ncbi:1,2-phenylacetyl-CoA epoxidase subunit PaaC [Angustibacter sp. McL0619]|uniref:1,2-phenylacetyl-CoA epoxidase subunit PaaC n=1 Tax=Angustibacter sp. McL0619 TaxID=3415676 RepID=UPI003CECF587
MSATTTTSLRDYALALGDDALVLAQRCGQWITRAPQLEEDVALANIGLDLLGQGRALLDYAGQVEGDGRGEDELAYLRDAEDFRNVRLVELDNGDFAVSMARLLAFSTYQLGLYTALSESSDELISGVAAKAVKEVTYHVDHAAEWVLRLGDGTDESHRRMQSGLELVWPYVPELFDASEMDADLLASGVAVDPSTLYESWHTTVLDVLTRATLTEPVQAPDPARGRRGEHSPALTELLHEMQGLHREHPGATW